MYPPDLSNSSLESPFKEVDKFFVWDLSHSLIFSKLTNLLELEVGFFSRSPRIGGPWTEDKKGCEQEGIESYGQRKSDIA